MKTRIGIIGAMDLEIEKLTKKEMDSKCEINNLSQDKRITDGIFIN